MKILVALVSGVLLSSAAMAQHEHGASTGGGNESAATASERSGGNGAGQAEAQGEGSDRVVCRRIDRTSSRVGRERVCMTAAQWREHDRND